MLNIITIDAAKLLEAERAAIFLLDRTTGQLWAKTALGVSVNRSGSIHGLELPALSWSRVKTSLSKTRTIHRFSTRLWIRKPKGFRPGISSTVSPWRNISCREIIGVFQGAEQGIEGKFTLRR